MSKYTIRHDKNESHRGFLSHGSLALGISVGMLTAILVVLGFDWLHGGKAGIDYLQVAPLVISLIVAMASAYFSASALREQRKAREAATDPVLIAHLGQRADARELITFNISNVGAGAALNVCLSIEMPQEQSEDLQKRHFVQNLFENREPISVILQGRTVEYNFALSWNLLGQSSVSTADRRELPHPLPPFRATLSYEDLAGGKYSSEFLIDVREIKGLGVHQTPQMRMVKALEAIAKGVR